MKTNIQRIKLISRKLNAAHQALEIAKAGLRSANKKNPFWSKSQAMKEINRLRKYNNQLAKIWNIEFKLI